MVLPMPPLRRRLLDSRALPAALVAVFVVLILITIRRFSIWIDESATLELVGLNGYMDIAHKTAIDVHPPLGYWVLKPWLQVFGVNIVAARAESAVFMLAAIGLWYHFVRTRFSRPLALLTLTILVTNPMMLHYAVEGRMYAFGVLLTALSTLLITGRWRWRWIAYWLVGVAMLYTHYFLAFALAAQFAYLLLRRRDQERSALWFVLFGASMIVAFAPWIPIARHGTHAVEKTGYWIGPLTPTTVLTYVLGAFLSRVDSDLTDWRVFPGMAYLAVWGASLIRAGRAKTGPYALLWIGIAVPWVLLFILSCKPFVPVFHPRYVIYGLPGMITLLCAGALAFTGRWRTVTICVLVAGNLMGLRMQRWRGFNDTRGYYSMKQIAREISKPIDGDLPTIVSTWLFPFFDARASLSDDQRVVFVRDKPPSLHLFPDVIYADRPDWYVFGLPEIRASHVWLLEDALASPAAVPDTWHLVVTHRRGYARTRLFTVGPPSRSGPAAPPVP